MAPIPSFGGADCDSPNYLLLVDSVTGRIELRHGCVFSALDPEVLGRSLATVLQCRTYGEAVSALLARGQTPHVPAFSTAPAATLTTVVRDTDPWVVVGYPPTFRPVPPNLHRHNYRPLAFDPVDRSPVVVAGVGPIGAKRDYHQSSAADLLPVAEGYYNILRVLKLV